MVVQNTPERSQETGMLNNVCNFCGKRYRGFQNQSYCSVACYDLDGKNRKINGPKAKNNMAVCVMCGKKYGFNENIRLKYCCSRRCSERLDIINTRAETLISNIEKIMFANDRFISTRITTTKHVIATNYRSIENKYHSYRIGAIRRGISFRLALDEFKRHWKKPCVYCGKDIDTIGLDRIDNSKGYSQDNVVPCCTQCNLSKRGRSLQDYLSSSVKIARRLGFLFA